MTSTVYTDFQNPAVNAAWLNDVNTSTYNTVPALTSALKFNAGANGTLAIGVGAVAIGTNSIALGTSSAAGLLSGTTDSIAIGTGAGSYGVGSTSIGNQGVAQGLYAISIGGGVAYADYAISIGIGSLANNTYSISMGYGANSSADKATAIGFGSYANTFGKYVYAGSFIINAGDTQTGVTVLSRVATAASTNYVLTSDTLVPSSSSKYQTNNQLTLPVSSAFSFDGTIVARQKGSAGTAVAGWTVSGVAHREATGNVLFFGTPTVTALGTVPTGWTMTCTLDTTNQAVAFTFNMGTTVMNVACMATIRSSELTYA